MEGLYHAVGRRFEKAVEMRLCAGPGGQWDVGRSIVCVEIKKNDSRYFRRSNVVEDSISFVACDDEEKAFVVVCGEITRGVVVDIA